MTTEEYGLQLAAQVPPLTEEQVEAFARLLVAVEQPSLADTG